jgi:hypothetical protein
LRENMRFSKRKTMISAKDLSLLEQALPHMSETERRRNLDLLTKYKAELVKEAGGKTFLEFIKHVYPDYKVGAHHAKLAKLFEEIAEGKRKRVIVNIAPRHGKSELISYLAPAWFLGKHPAKKVIMASHTADLAVNFGRRVRNLVGSDAYKDIFPKVELQADSKSASIMGNTLLLVSVALSPVVVLTCLLLMTPIQSKMPKSEKQTCFYQLGSGSNLVLYNDLCRAERL